MDVRHEIAKQVEALPPEMQEQVLQFVTSLAGSAPKGRVRRGSVRPGAAGSAWASGAGGDKARKTRGSDFWLRCDRGGAPSPEIGAAPTGCARFLLPLVLLTFAAPSI